MRMLKLLFYCCFVTFANFIPVHYVPECCDVVRAFVLVVQVVSVLPHIQTKDWRFAFEDRAVLVRQAVYFQFAVSNSKESPAAAETSCRCFSEFCFECIEAA
ncbi:hypothetical protein D3C77_682700 [compost metagenome]